MNVEIKIQLNEKLFLRDPLLTELGKNIIREGVKMINQLGFEHFTFKKLAAEIKTTEASIYRYFENKHRLLHYLIAWHWTYLEYQVMFSLNNLQDVREKIKKVIQILVENLDSNFDSTDIDKKALYQVVIAESSKVYLTKEVSTFNKSNLFKPYKDLAGRIADLLMEFNPSYKYSHSLASTMIEMAHFQSFFAANLPRLTDFKDTNEIDTYVKEYLENLVFAVIR